LTKEHPEVERVASVFSDDNMGHQEADAVKACCDYYGLEHKNVFLPVETVEQYPTATSLMPWDPDLVITVLGTAVVDIMWEMGYEGLTMTSYWLEAHGEDKGWDRCKGHLIIMPHPLGDPWPESAALAEEFEDRYGMELVPAAWWTFMVVSVMTDVLKQAGTVDDTDKIIETMESRAGFETQAGPLYYGLQELNGIGHVAIWPSPIYEIVGDHEYRVITVYTPEETEALAIEIFKK
jgi:ABC-type branched-subunit amino acid transport system substrate-binding protein